MLVPSSMPTFTCPGVCNTQPGFLMPLRVQAGATLLQLAFIAQSLTAAAVSCRSDRSQLMLPTFILRLEGLEPFFPLCPSNKSYILQKVTTVVPLLSGESSVRQCIMQRDPNCNPALRTCKSLSTLERLFFFVLCPFCQ